RRVGAPAGIQHPAGARAPLRGGERRGAGGVPGGGRRLARRPERSRVKQAARRWALLVAVGVLVVVLVGGRWAAFETAERGWAARRSGAGHNPASERAGR